MKKAAPVFVGIDVSAAHLDVAVLPGGETWRIAYDVEGMADVVARLVALAPERVVLEATGGLDWEITAELSAAALPVCVVNPRQVRDYARARGILAKTDRIDSLVIAGFAEAVKPEVRPLPDTEMRALRALVSRRRQLVQMIAAEKKRRKRAPRRIQERIDTHIRWLEQEIDDLEKDIERAVHSSPAWRAKDQLLRSVPGVGQVLAATVLAELPELGQASDKEIAALVGVAPFSQDSGKRRGKRTCRGGRAKVRWALYMAAVAARRCNPVIRAFFERLIAAGKGTKQALIACARKLLEILSAMLRSNQPWRSAPVS